MEEECDRLRNRVAALQKCEEWLQKQVAELEEQLSREWQWTDENLPGLEGRLLICVHGSTEEAFYKDGKFIHAQYGERKPKAWRTMPGAPWCRRGQYMP
jgi:predicted metal-dependent hydrolase